MKKFKNMTRDEKLETIFDFYMFVDLKKTEEEKKETIELDCIFSKSNCSGKQFFKQEKILCSEFKFIGKHKDVCFMDHYGCNLSISLIKKLLVDEGFIPKGE